MTAHSHISTNFTTFNLAEDAMLIKVSISCFTGRKKDKVLAEEVALQKNANSDNISTSLSALDKEDRMPTQQIATAARNWLNEHSAIWDSDGWRLIGNATYEGLRQKLEEFKAEFIAAKDKLCARRDELASKAKHKLGKLADRCPFPELHELHAAFEFEIMTQPIANPDDIRLKHVSPQAAAQIAEGVRKAQAAKTQDALRQLVSRLLDTVTHAANKLSEKDAIFRDTLIDNVRDTVALVPALNLTNDPHIAKLAKEIAETVALAKPEVLREDPVARKVVADKAAEAVKKGRSILEKLQGGAVSNRVN